MMMIPEPPAPLDAEVACGAGIDAALPPFPEAAVAFVIVAEGVLLAPPAAYVTEVPEIDED
jgi:hypothetical protein